MKDLPNNLLLIAPNLHTEQLAFDLIVRYEIEGLEIFDTVLVATALSHGVKHIVTDNAKHMEKYQEIEVVNPF